MSKTVKQSKIVSLQALRGLAFLGIFLNHAKGIIHWSELGVSVFFVLSGFLMTHTYGDRDFDVSIKKNFYFSIKKIKKIYPLHIFTMICAVVLALKEMVYNGLLTRSLITLVGEIFLNVTLLQTWVPHSSFNISLNGVAWYLSVTMFLYFMFPYILRWIKNKPQKKLSIMGVVILATQIITCIPFTYFWGGKNSPPPIYIWFMYCFPVFRLGDFFVGCCLGSLYTKKENRDDLLVRYSIYELLATALTVGVHLLERQSSQSVILLAFQNWTTLYIPVAAIWIYLFADNGGIITKLFNNRFLVYLGDISSYNFLIHYVIIRYTSNLCKYFDVNVHGWPKVGTIFAELILSVIVTVIYMKLEGNVKNTIMKKKNI